MTLFFTFIVSTFVTMVLIPPLVRAAAWLHAADVPSERKIHKIPMPRLGGVAMAIGTVLPLLMWQPLQRQVTAFLIGVAIILLFGVWDDIRRLNYRAKFAGQIVGALVVVMYGGITITHLPFRGLDDLPAYVAVPLTAFVLVGVTNAINLADGLDGLAGGIALISLASMAVLAYMSPNAGFVLIATVSVIGSILGFLRYNTYPASIFMGDGGSQFLGFCAGVLAITLTQDTNTALSPALPLMILGLPILDTLLVMAERIHEGRSPFVADRKHIHHRMLALGFHHYEAVLAIYVLQSALVAAAYFLRFESDWLVVSAYLLFSLALVTFLKIAPTTGYRLHTASHESGSAVLPSWIQWLRQDQRLLKGAFYCAAGAIPAFLFTGTLFVRNVPRDIGTLAFAMLAVVLALYLRYRHKPFHIIERASAYITGICVVYLVRFAPEHRDELALYCGVLFAVMALAVVIAFRVGAERFRITPTDFLVVFLAVAVPNLPGLDFRMEHLGLGVAMIIVLFYSIELVLNNVWRRWDLMRATTYLTLAGLSLRGVMGT